MTSSSPRSSSAEADDPTGGVCVGRPVPGAEVRITALGFDPEELPAELPAGATGEILVRAPWVSEGYLGLWAVERAARPGSGDWHRSGDVGHVDTSGRLWVEGRAVHVIHAAGGPITSVPVERIVERELNIGRVAAVGVGPVGTQQLVIVVEQAGVVRRSGGHRDVRPRSPGRHGPVGTPRRLGAGSVGPAGRHPAQREDRPNEGRGVGNRSARGSSGPLARMTGRV